MLGVGRGRIVREMTRVMVHRIEGNRRELAIGSRIELNRKSRAERIVAIAHGEVRRDWCQLSIVRSSAPR